MSLQVGQTAPPFLGQEVTNGVPISLHNYLHKPVVLAFSGLAWCPPCQLEAPILQEIWQSHGSSVQFIIVNINGDPAKLPAAIQQFGLTMPVIDDTDLLIAKDYIFDGTPQTGTSYSVPHVFVLKPSPEPPPLLPSQADHYVVCSRKDGAVGPEAALKADLASRVEACIPASGSRPGYWEEFDPIPWLDPGPLRLLTPEKRDVLISLGIGELARNLSSPRAAHRLERFAADALLEAARAVRGATRNRVVPPPDAKAIETRSVKS